MARHHTMLLCGWLLISGAGCRSTHTTSAAPGLAPLASLASAHDPSRARLQPEGRLASTGGPPTPTAALSIPGKGADESRPVGPPPSLAFGGEAKRPSPDHPTLPPLPVGDLPPRTAPEAASPPIVLPPPVDAPAPPAAPLPAPPPVAERPAEPGPEAAATNSPNAKMESPLRALHARAAKQYAKMDSYIMRLKRREVVGGAGRPEEIMLCKIRKEPFSAYLKWLGEEGKGREVVYVNGQHGGLIHSLTATGDVLFLPGGKRFKVAPDSILVKSKSRYPITEAGLGPLIERFGRLVEASEKGDTREGMVKYLGELKRPEFENKVAGVHQKVPARSDPNLPHGGERQWYFDTATGLPVLIITHDETGREVEYYCHDRFIFPANLRDEDFDPDLLWKSES